MTTSEYLIVIRRRWRTLALLLLFGLLGGSVIALATPVQYSSTARAFISIRSASSTADLAQGNTYIQQLTRSYADVASSPLVLSPVIERLGLDVSALALAKSINVTSASDESVIEIVATDRSASNAAAIANSITQGLARAVVDLSPSSSGSSAEVKISQIQTALPASDPSQPNIFLNLVGGLVVGFVAGLAVVALRETLDTRVLDGRSLRQVTELPVIGNVTFNVNSSASSVVAADDNQSAQSENYKTIRTNLRFLRQGRESFGVVVTSAVPSEGKSTTAANLAVSVASGGARVVVVDADMRRPKLASYLGVDGALGLADYLVGAASVSEVSQSWGSSGLRVIPAGSIPPNPSELLQSERMRELLDELSGDYELVILDAPPALAVTDAALLASEVDGAMVVCSVRSCRKPQLRAALSALADAGAKPLGVVLNMVPLQRGDSYSYMYK